MYAAKLKEKKNPNFTKIKANKNIKMWCPENCILIPHYEILIFKLIFKVQRPISRKLSKLSGNGVVFFWLFSTKKTQILLSLKTKRQPTFLYIINHMVMTTTLIKIFLAFIRNIEKCWVFCGTLTYIRNLVLYTKHSFVCGCGYCTYRK